MRTRVTAHGGVDHERAGGAAVKKLSAAPLVVRQVPDGGLAGRGSVANDRQRCQSSSASCRAGKVAEGSLGGLLTSSRVAPASDRGNR